MTLNEVTLIGNLGKEPEQRSLPNGNPVASFSLATSEKFTSNGETKEETQWHNIVLFGKLAETAITYLHKGSKIWLRGSIKYRSYEKDGITKYITDIIGTKFIMLDRKESSESYKESSEPDYGEVPF